MSLSAPPPPPPPRIPLVDVARGVALMAMAVFHFAYDLSDFRLIEIDVASEPGWRWFARIIAGSFLTLVGVSLVLATRGGVNREAFLRRLAMVAGAALLVTVATRFAMPQSYIFFGILHHVALASVLGLAFLRAPVALLVAAAALCLALPALVDFPALDWAWLDAPWLAFLGLSPIQIRSADFVPVFPWFGCVLAGMALARLVLLRDRPPGWTLWSPPRGPAGWLGWCGRHSLAFYLIHQPVLIGAIMLATWIAPVAAPEDRPFLLSCERSCTSPSVEPAACKALCACAMASLKRENLWRQVLADRLNPKESARAAELARACLRTP